MNAFLRMLLAIYKFFAALVELIVDDAISMLMAACSSLIPSWWFAQIRIPYAWWPNWSQMQWAVGFISVFWVFRLWRTLRKAAV